MILQWIIIIGFFLDMVFTHSYLKMYKKRFPKNDYTFAEANVFLRLCIKKIGLGLGMVVGGSILGVFIAIIINLLRVEILYMLIGFYYAINIQHFVNNRALKKIIQSKGGKK